MTTAEAIKMTLESPNVADSNMERANVVDVLDKIAVALFNIGDAINNHALAVRETMKKSDN